MLFRSDINQVNTLSELRFLDFSNTSNQGDYIIITDSLIRKSKNGDAIEQYKQYRSSAVGGNFKVLVVNVQELTNQLSQTAQWRDADSSMHTQLVSACLALTIVQSPLHR